MFGVTTNKYISFSSPIKYLCRVFRWVPR